MKLPASATDLGLPHRAPFLFVDEVCDLVAGERASGTLKLNAETPFFAGHFPGRALVPGVILAEAIAQLSGIAAASPGRSFLLSAIRSMKFPSAAHPDEVIDLKARVVADHSNLVQCEGVASVGNRVVAEGSVILSNNPVS